MPEIKPNEVESIASIKVVGVGGAGGAAINRMREEGLQNVELIAMNTDAQALRNSKADKKIHLRLEDKNGLGAGADPLKGQKAAEASREEIREAVEGADMVFVTFGAGGGTGSGAGYIVAEEARNLGILTVGVVTKPFAIEGEVRRTNAEWAIERLARNVDALITIPNERLLQVVDPNMPWRKSFRIADDVLRQGVQGITEIITEEHDINLDFADVEAIMKDAGSALMGIGRASGENRAEIAAQQAIESPLIEVSIDGARGVLYLVSGGEDVTMAELQAAGTVITSNVNPEANIIMGASVRPELGDEIMVTVIATGFDSEYYRDDPRAAELFRPGGARLADESEEAPVQPVEEQTEAEEEQQPVIENNTPAANSDFASANTSNIWSSIPSANDDDDSDIPAILRRRRKNRD